MPAATLAPNFEETPMSDPTDLIEFLRARLDEDEQAATDCAGAPWSAAVPGMIHVDPKAIANDRQAYGRLGYVASVEHEHDRQHIARHDPARVLVEVTAKRAILGSWRLELSEDGEPLGGQAAELYWDTIRALALPHSGHPNYREAWRP